MSTDSLLFESMHPKYRDGRCVHDGGHPRPHQLQFPDGRWTTWTDVGEVNQTPPLPLPWRRAVHGR